MKSVTFIGHQGDLCVYEINEFPTGERIEDEQCKTRTLAYGELTGHAHQFDELDAVEVFKIGQPIYRDVLFVSPKKDTVLRHGRDRDFKGKEPDQWYHSTVEFKQGKKYITGIVEETDWLTKTIRKVVD